MTREADQHAEAGEAGRAGLPGRPGIATIAVHAGRPGRADLWGTGPAGEWPAAPPVFLTSNYEYPSADAADQAAQGRALLYSRYGNPTVEAFERALAELEQPPGAPAAPGSGGATPDAPAIEAVATGSGMAALATTLLALAAGGEVLVSEGLYGVTTELARDVLPRLGIQARFVPAWDTDAVARAIGSGTRAILVESLTNPLLRVCDLPALGALARARGVALIVDATFTPPCLLRPLAHGAAVVVHSVSKYLAGHGDLLAGVAVADRETATAIRKQRAVLGGILDPFCAFLALRGLRTLPLRFARQAASAAHLARALAAHPAVRAVHYPGLLGHPDHARARALLGEHPGAMLSFDVGSLKAARAFYDRVRLVRRAASLGDVASLLTHPASFSHRALPAAARAATGIGDGLLRLSVGIEDAADLEDDLREGLRGL